MKKPAEHLIAEVPSRQSRVATTIGIDLGDIWSHYCTLNQDAEVIDRGRFRTTPKAIEKWFTDVPHARIAMEAGTHSIWISEQLQELGHEVIVANVRECGRSPTVIARATRSMPRSWRGMHGLTQRSCADRTSDGRATAGADADPRPRPYGSPAHSSGERRPWANQVLRSSHAGFFDPVLRSTQSKGDAARARTGAGSSARADRRDDDQDQAVRPSDPAARPDKLSRDPSTPEGSRRG